MKKTKIKTCLLCPKTIHHERKNKLYCSREHLNIHYYMIVGETLEEYNIRKKIWEKRKKELKALKNKSTKKFDKV